MSQNARVDVKRKNARRCTTGKDDIKERRRGISTIPSAGSLVGIKLKRTKT